MLGSPSCIQYHASFATTQSSNTILLIMKSLYPLLVSLLAASVSAHKHRLCCCAGYNACNQFVCDPYSAGWLVQHKPIYIRSNKYWGPKTGAPAPGWGNYIYATDKNHGDDEFIGGTEMSENCFGFGLSSKCFDPSNFRNTDAKLKTRQHNGEKLPIGGGGGAKGGGAHGENNGGGDHPQKVDVVGGGVRGSRKLIAGDADHWPYCPSH